MKVKSDYFTGGVLEILSKNGLFDEQLIGIP